MKYKIIFFLLLLLNVLKVYGSETHVKKTINALKIVDEPKGCFKSASYPCAIKSLKRNQITQEESTLNLEKNSILIFYSKDHWRLLEGVFYFKGLQKLKIDTNQIGFRVSGELMIIADVAKTQILNSNAEIILDETDLQRVSPPVGFQNWYGYSNSNITEGVLEPIQLMKFAKLWIPFFNGNENDVKKNLSFYKEIWAGNTQQAAEYYLTVTQRKIASEEKNEEIRRKRNQENKEENERLKKLFRNRSTGAEFF